MKTSGNLLKSAVVIVVLLLIAIPSFFIVGFYYLISLSHKKAAQSGRTVLLTGGKMTKCLQLARMFSSQGDRVIVAETSLYRFCGTRFSNTCNQFIIIPEIIGDGQDYINALVRISIQYKVDLFVPIASPKSAYYDALAIKQFPKRTEVFHYSPEIVNQLDDKHKFINLAKSFGLSVPESYLIKDKESLLNHNFTVGKRFILKKIDYDPVYRMDLRTLPHTDWKARVKKLPIDLENRWVLQEFIEGTEICTHTTTQNGDMNLYICCNSSPFQVNYEMLHIPEVKDWVTKFIRKLNITGQVSFDFIIKNDGSVIPIECNPRTHSAITLFYDQLDAAKAYYRNTSNDLEYEPSPNAGHTYWLFHELHRLLKTNTQKDFIHILNIIFTGKESVFSKVDPLPFWFNNFISIPFQILNKSTIWEKIDFNIGKLIIPNGD